MKNINSLHKSLQRKSVKYSNEVDKTKLELSALKNKVEEYRGYRRSWEKIRSEYEKIFKDMVNLFVEKDINKIKIWIIRDKDNYRLRGKSYFRGQSFWVHIGLAKDYKGKSLKELKEIAKTKIETKYDFYFRDKEIVRRINLETRLDPIYKDENVKSTIREVVKPSRDDIIELENSKENTFYILKNIETNPSEQNMKNFIKVLRYAKSNIKHIYNEIENIKLNIRDLRKYRKISRLRKKIYELERNKKKVDKFIDFINNIDSKIRIKIYRGYVYGHCSLLGEKIQVCVGKSQNYPNDIKILKTLSRKKIEKKLLQFN